MKQKAEKLQLTTNSQIILVFLNIFNIILNIKYYVSLMYMKFKIFSIMKNTYKICLLNKIKTNHDDDFTVFWIHLTNRSNKNQPIYP